MTTYHFTCTGLFPANVHQLPGEAYCRKTTQQAVDFRPRSPRLTQIVMKSHSGIAARTQASRPAATDRQSGIMLQTPAFQRPHTAITLVPITCGAIHACVYILC
jgi:hypothetical protein